MTARLPLVTVHAAVLTIGGVLGGPPPAPPHPRAPTDSTALYLAELRQRPALAPSDAVRTRDIAGNTVRDGGTQNQAAGAQEQRGRRTVRRQLDHHAALVGVCPDQITGMRADAGPAGTVAQLAEDSR